MNPYQPDYPVTDTDIAIIGLGCRLPGANDPAQFWQNLHQGVESVTFFSDDQLLAQGVSPDLLQNPRYIKANPVLDYPQAFDAGFFGIPALEAEMMDPQQRIFLECVWEALESAGTIPEQTSARIGLFAGAGISSYLHRVLPHNGDFFASVANFQMMLGNDKDYLPTRVSYRLNLTGPSINVQTACSTSLVALHLACQSILSGECDLALAGGASVFQPHQVGYLFQAGMIFSPDGHCRPFDAQAKGTTFGSGVGVVVLKLLSQALEEGDPIRAVVKGSAVNNDGSGKVGFTAPSVQGQAAVIAEAMGVAGVSPEEISYVEAHGTATELGDPIEIRALTQAYGNETDRQGYCAIGSVKSNLGHLISASGVAGLIKTVLALEHEQIPPSLHFTAPNPAINFDQSPFFVNTELRDWPRNDEPRIAGVSSFGIGGTNAHAIVAEAPPSPEPSPSCRPRSLLTLSGQSPQAVRELAQKYANWLQTHPNISFADTAYTTHLGRKHFKIRATYGAANSLEMIAALTDPDVVPREIDASQPLAFLCTGQGCQFAGMGKTLYETEPVFREIITRCDQAFRGHRGQSLVDVIFAEPIVTDPNREVNNDLIHQTEFTQPGLYAIECGLAALFLSWGVQPDLVLGHSIGEFVAAWVAGVFELETGLLLVAERGRLMQELSSTGGMVSVFATPAMVNRYLDSNPDLAVAVINGPEAVVVSGPHPALERLTSQLQAEQIGHKALVVSHGFHSPLMEPILEPFHQFASQFSFQPPQLPFVSNRTGTLIPPGQALDATYWTDHIRATVRFHEGLTTAVDSGTNLFLELGPKPVLCGLGQRSFPSLTWIPTLQGPNEPAADGLEALGTLYTCGIDLDWNAFHAQEHRSKIPLPTYAFQRQNYWPENSLIPMTASNVTASNSTHHSTNSTNDSPTPISPMNNQVSARISQEITTMVAKMMRMEPAALDLQTSFLGLGLDSLTLLNVIAQIEKQYGVTLGIHQFLDQLTNLQELIDFLSQIVSEQDVLQPASPQAVVVSPAPQPVAVASNNGNQNGSQNGNQNGSNNGTSNGSSNGASNGPAIVQPLNSLTALDSATSSPLERVIAQQMTLMAKQLEAMQGQGPGQSTVSVAGNTAPIASPTSAPSPTPPTVQPAPAPTAPSATSQSRPAAASTNAPAPFSFWGAKGTAGPTPTPEQQAFIDQLVQDYCQRTQGSKASAAAYRDYLADRRSIRGLRPEIKEMFYPIVAERGKGSRIWDVDGNEYIDITMGFGVHLLGHNPDFINQALQQTLTTGVQVGPQYPLTGEVAQLFSQLTGKERVTFCNSGTEAVMTALRIARAASGKAKIIKFKGAYHGHFDGTLAIPADTNGDPNREPYGEPMFPGTSPAMVQDVIVLDYGKPESLEVIKRHQGELAAVIVEPVQSRLLSLAPQEFLHELRAITKAANVPLIFDEVILGFRAAPGGAQEYFGVEADIATYGKALGGGMPIGVVAGKAQFMDYIDGGTWRYGDQSYPQTDPTYFAGTFCKHPLAMTAAKAVLRHLQTQGGALQAKLNDATARLVGELNRYFQTEGLMLRADQFASIFRIEFQSMFSELYLPLEMDLLFYLLVHKGVYVWEGRVCFLSEAHTDEDIDRIIAVVKESVEDLRAVGYFPAPKNRATNGTGNSVTKDLKKNAVTA